MALFPPSGGPNLPGHPHVEQELMAAPMGGYNLITSDKRTGLHKQVVIRHEETMMDPNAVQRTATEQMMLMEEEYRRKQMEYRQQMMQAQLYAQTSAAIAGYSDTSYLPRMGPQPSSHLEDSFAYLRQMMRDGRITVPESKLSATIDLLDREGPLAYLRARTREFIKDVRLTNG